MERAVFVKDIDKFGFAICAFSNDFPAQHKPGYLIIGVKDDDKLSGLKVSDQLLQNLGGLRLIDLYCQNHKLTYAISVLMMEI